MGDCRSWVAWRWGLVTKCLDTLKSRTRKKEKKLISRSCKRRYTYVCDVGWGQRWLRTKTLARFGLILMKMRTYGYELICIKWVVLGGRSKDTYLVCGPVSALMCLRSAVFFFSLMICRQLVVILAYVGRRSSVRPIFVVRSRFDCNFACSVASDGDDGKKKLALSESYWQSWLHLMCYYAWGLTGACWVLHRLLWFEQHASESGGGKQQRNCFLNDVWYAYGIQSDEHACSMGPKNKSWGFYLTPIG